MIRYNFLGDCKQNLTGKNEQVFVVLFTFDIIDASVPTSSDNKALLARSFTLRVLILDLIKF